MKALITGASSGIGYDMAKYLSELGYDLIVVARRKDRLELLSKEVKTNVQIIELDLSVEGNCKKLYNEVYIQNIDVLINNAGFGVFGEFTETELDKEIELININIKAVHILTKLFLKDMKEKNNGYILNVASIAAFVPGPLMATYYSSKSYVLKLTESIYEELKRVDSKVKISVLCPGPVKTEFNTVANVKFNSKYLTSEYVAKYGINKMLKGKLIIVPGIDIKIARVLSKIVPDKVIMKVTYKIQKRKI
jgi:Short-chain dehydrogenases of various substrate specificities